MTIEIINHEGSPGVSRDRKEKERERERERERDRKREQKKERKRDIGRRRGCQGEKRECRRRKVQYAGLDPR